MVIERFEREDLAEIGERFRMRMRKRVPPRSE